VSFTRTPLDALLLKFDLFPGGQWKPKWGSRGYEESQRWPLLPLGMMTDGDPVSEEDARGCPLFLLGVVNEVPSSPDLGSSPSHEGDTGPCSQPDRIAEIMLALDLGGSPEKLKPPL
jgi:hypothetical protein